MRLRGRHRSEKSTGSERRKVMNTAQGAPWGSGCPCPGPHSPRSADTGDGAQPVLRGTSGRAGQRKRHVGARPTDLACCSPQAPPGPPTPYPHDSRPPSPLQCDRPADASLKAGPGAGGPGKCPAWSEKVSVALSTLPSHAGRIGRLLIRVSKIKRRGLCEARPLRRVPFLRAVAQ